MGVPVTRLARTMVTITTLRLMDVTMLCSAYIAYMRGSHFYFNVTMDTSVYRVTIIRKIILVSYLGYIVSVIYV